MPFCPECRDEFVASVSRCPDCDRELVEDLASVPPPPPEDPGEEPEDSTPVVVVAHLPDEDRARALVSALRQMAIPSRIGREEGEGLPVEVPEDFAAAASSVVARLADDGEAPELSAEDVARLDRSAGALRREGPAAVESLVRLLVRGRGETAHRAALRLAGIGGEAVGALRGALVRAVEVDEGEVARAAVRALRQEGHSEAPPGLVALVAEERPEIRARALRTLAALGSRDGLPVVVRALRDPEIEVREEAADAVWELAGVDLDWDGDPAAVEDRIRALEERYGG